jgi:hypothetical protein
MPTLVEVIDAISAAKVSRDGDGYRSVADVTDPSEIRRVASFVHAIGNPDAEEVETIVASLIGNDDRRGELVTALTTLWPECESCGSHDGVIPVDRSYGYAPPELRCKACRQKDEDGPMNDAEWPSNSGSSLGEQQIAAMRLK